MSTEKEPDRELIARLQQLIDKGLFTKAEMARAANVKPQAITKWFERGELSRTAAMGLAVAKLISLDWLLLGRGPMFFQETAESNAMAEQALHRAPSAANAFKEFDAFISRLQLPSPITMAFFNLLVVYANDAEHGSRLAGAINTLLAHQQDKS